MELQFGTYWLPRIGIVILLTGLVFLGNYAYQRFVPLLGPGGKLALLGLAGASLGALGAWVERSGEAMRNYGRVLMAGGAATLYYTAYAAHFVERLRVIESPLVGGLVLLALTAAIVWYAERRKSEPTALLAVLLAYYTSAINSIGTFTLFSNLLLTAAAVVLLIRQRWVLVPLVSLIATYGSYAFWRFHSVVTTGTSGSGEFGTALWFLAGYWTLFTVAVFLVDRATAPAAQRAAFLTANNGAFFAFAALHFDAHRPDSFWMFAVGFGALLLALAAVAARRQPEDRAMDGAYLAQGIALVTVGLAAKLTGPQLATTLAVESAVLLYCSRWRHGWLYQIAAALTAIGAFGLAAWEIERRAELAVALGAPVAALLIFDAWCLKHSRGELAAMRISERAVGFALLGLALVGFVIWRSVPEVWQPAAFAVAAVVSAASIFVLRLPEVSLPGQFFLAVGVGLYSARQFGSGPLAARLPLLIAAIALVHWWQKQRIQPLQDNTRTALQLACAAAAAVVGTFWLREVTIGDSWLWATATVAFGSLLYAMATRAWSVAMAGQWFTLLSIHAFAMGLIFGHPHWAAALSPVVNLAVTAVVASPLVASRFGAGAANSNLQHAALFYRVLASVLFAAWGFEYVEARWRMAFFAGLGAMQMLAGSALRNPGRVAIGAAYAAAGFCVFWIRLREPAAWPDVAAILAIPASLQLCRRFADGKLPPADARNALTAVALASLWRWCTQYTLAHGQPGHLTVVWALLALVIFGAGLGLRERVYRLGGLTILAVAIGRIFIVDVWKLETIFRILSFLTLGAVLLLLGFVYNRFADAIRKWL